MSGERFDRALQRAVSHLADDGFLAYPTETVWGLGACADRVSAVEALRAWKGRGSDAPLAVLVASIAGAGALGCRFETPARRLAEAFWPGPLTLVLPCDGTFAPGVARGDGALGLRCSPHPVAGRLARAILESGLGPLTATSLNRTGEPPARGIDEARALVTSTDGTVVGRDRSGEPGSAPLWLEDLVEGGADDAGGGAPSSVVDCTAETPRILREGALAAGVLEQAWKS